ncbi:complex I subunit 5 family protein [Desulfonatronovibrio hydrogenovorans]|uniref:complex I subunit 5 family protein n=1 Tax=Desulfonatronovibrio hydrogenovorans TaxID=53245 RepID=UPI00048D257A|nr:proton-conducting transporter membrane subunit [Desulfonatronovibrio hydrogenovorans]
MDLGFWLPILVLSSSLITGLIIFFLKEESTGLRTVLNLLAAAFKVVAVHYMAFRLLVLDKAHEVSFSMGLGFDFVLRVDFLSLMFVSLSSNLWLVTTLYAVGYLEGSPNRSRFFGFFSLCVTASTGIALAGNLITFFIFYEFLTLVTYPLVVHRETRTALEAGRTYLWYTILGGSFLFVGVVWLQVIAGPLDFIDTGILEGLGSEHHRTLSIIFLLLIVGLGVKAALVPLHGWLPVAMVAPAPVSALLHAVAVVKAGAFGIVRVVFDVFGRDFAGFLGLLAPLAGAAALTIIFGSVRALYQTDLKKRLAYSTVSQVSYITIGAAVIAPFSTVGAIVHLVHQGVMKITLFFCAGNIAETLGLHKIRDIKGVARRMPVTAGLFTIAAFGMIGVPPLAGFISKWYLGIGGLDAGKDWILAVLVLSSILNSAYFLPVIHAMWFEHPDKEWKTLRPSRFEAPWTLLLPPLITAAAALLAGILAGWEWSPLGVAKQIAQGMGVYP